MVRCKLCDGVAKESLTLNPHIFMEKTNTLAGNGAKGSAVNNSYNSARNTANGVAAAHSATRIEDTQWTKYHHKTGHGFAAEDINAQTDRWLGHKVECVGRNNALNGADRIVDGVAYQTKYCQNAGRTVNAAFDTKSGMYRYDGMKLEVPSDQYDECVRLMREAIAKGRVNGVTDPEMAKQIVVKGHATYRQAQKAAKAGNVESLKFDLRTQLLSCAGAGAIAGAIGYINAIRNGASHGEAMKAAGKVAVMSGATALAGGVLAQQALSTSAGHNFAAAMTKGMKPGIEAAMKTQIGKEVLTKTASAMAGRQVAGQAAVNVLTKAARTNAVTSAAVFVATSIPDTVRLCQGKISGADYAENLASNAAGIGGGWGGASAGAAIGTAICPGVGTVIGGLVGGIGGGMAGSALMRKFTGMFR